MTEPIVRPAIATDLPHLAKMAGALVRMHHAVDPARFFLPERIEEGYEGWLAREIARDRARVVVAEIDGRVVGYAYGTLEARDWNMLLDEHGAIHDIFVADDARKAGVGKRLLDDLVARLEAAGAARVILQTMVSNVAAQRLFAAAGFRATMLEMTR